MSCCTASHILHTYSIKCKTTFIVFAIACEIYWHHNYTALMILFGSAVRSVDPITLFPF